MFGLENQNKKTKKKVDTFVFDLEKDWKDPNKVKETRELIEGRMQQIKGILHSGGSKEDIDKLGLILHGYASLLKVMSRCATQKNK